MLTRQLSRGRYIAAAFVIAIASFAAALPAPKVAASGGNGSVVSSTNLVLAPTLAAIATGKKIKYISTDTTGKTVVVSGVVLTPKAQYRPADGQRHTVAWAHGTEGIADRCAPSKYPNFDANPASATYFDALTSYVQQGWTVAATDYQGLGTPGIHQYLAGDTEARSLIDSVRAARKLDSTLSNKWALSGHSQGGQAVLFASEKADSYGKGLDLKGTVALAPASNVNLLAAGIPGTPGNGYLVLGLIGLAAVDPSVDVKALLAPPAEALLPVAYTGCYVEVLTAYQGLTAEQLIEGGSLPADILAKFGQYGNPAQQAPTAPTLLVHGDADEAVPAAVTQQLLHPQLCAYGTPVQLNIYPGQSHDPVIPASSVDVIAYLHARFANQPAPSNCP